MDIVRVHIGLRLSDGSLFLDCGDVRCVYAVVKFQHNTQVIFIVRIGKSNVIIDSHVLFFFGEHNFRFVNMYEQFPRHDDIRHSIVHALNRNLLH